MKQGGVIIVWADGIHHRLVPELVSLAIRHAALDPAAREPTAKPLAVVFAPGLFGRAVVLANGQPPDLAPPLGIRGGARTARLEVLVERGGGWIGLRVPAHQATL